MTAFAIRSPVYLILLAMTMIDKMQAVSALFKSLDSFESFVMKNLNNWPTTYKLFAHLVTTAAAAVSIAVRCHVTACIHQYILNIGVYYGKNFQITIVGQKHLIWLFIKALFVFFRTSLLIGKFERISR